MGFHTNGKTLYQEVNNPGRGDCGFYAFAIGIIGVIQQKMANGDIEPRQFKIFNELTTFDDQYNFDDFKYFNYDLQKNSDRAFLEKLKIDLRAILFNRYKQELCQSSVIIEGSNTIRKSIAYMQFAEIFYFYHQEISFDKEMNLFWSSQEIRRFASDLAKKFQDIRNSKHLEFLVQATFMQDLYGDDYLNIAQIPWFDAITNTEGSNLTKPDKQIIALFKQFRRLVEDYYSNSYSDRVIPGVNFKIRDHAVQCAQTMRELKASLHHARIKLLVDMPENLEEGTLYLQLVGENGVRVYSHHLDKGYDYTESKAGSLLNSLRRNHLNFSPNSELTNSDSKLFNTILSTADDILNERIVYKTITEEFCKLEHQATNKLDLIQSKHAADLSFQEKKQFQNAKAIEVEEKTKTESKIIGALKYIKKDREWLATHQDLNYLSELFEVHLDNLQEGLPNSNSQGVNEHNRPTVTINNRGNSHWTTYVQIGSLPENSALKYAGWCYENVPLSKTEIKKVLLSYTTGFVQLFGRTHRAKAEELIAQCENEESDVATIMQDLRAYMHSLAYNSKSSFLKRFEYLEARFQNGKNLPFGERDIEKIFSHYVHTGYFRNHLVEAHRIIESCRSGKNIDQLIEDIQNYVDKNQFNTNSSFIECFNQVKQLKLSNDNTEHVSNIEVCI